MTRTVSPSSNCTLGLGLSVPSEICVVSRCHLRVRDRRRLLVGAAPDEPGHLGRVLHQVPGPVVHLHLNEDVAGEELPLRGLLLALHHLDDLLHRDEDLPERILRGPPAGSSPRGSSSPCSRSPSRCGPTYHFLSAITASPTARAATPPSACSSSESMKKRITPATSEATTTAMVETWVSCQAGPGDPHQLRRRLERQVPDLRAGPRATEQRPGQGDRDEQRGPLPRHPRSAVGPADPPPPRAAPARA